ncbi:4,4'-diaponeurosporenoate glycosyltransferase [Sporosarcina sp. NCCP-2222]|nr:4,4'-diaponeurosporenoate glycosyltransferase [Sporosarcina sp. NCCP-2222]
MIIVLTVAGLLGAVGVLAGGLMFLRFPSPPAADHPFTSSLVSVIIPARNEEQRIVPLLRSLAKQTVIDFEIIVVDDDSEDQTAKIAQSYGAHVIRNLPPEDGWIGKSAACWAGVQAATGDLLLFMDADTEFQENTSLLKYVSSYEQLGGTGIVSLQPYHRVVSWYENVAALFPLIAVVGMNVFSAFSGRFSSAGSFGPCLLCRREEYEQVGGHAGVRGHVMDDLALGRNFQEAEYPVHCYSGKGLVTLRMYSEGPGQMVESLTKSFATGASFTAPAVMLLINLWIAGGLAIAFMLPASFIVQNSMWNIISLVLYIGFSAIFALFARRIGDFNIWMFLFYPIHILLFTLIFLRSAYLGKVRKRVSWRGRDIHV